MPFLFGSGCGRSPEGLDGALARLRREGRLGLVIRLPADPDRRRAIGDVLRGIVRDRNLDTHEALLEAAFLCLEDEAVRSRLRGARPGEDLLLVDGDGYVMAGCKIGRVGDLLDAARGLLYGAEDERLRERAAATRKNATREALAAFEELARCTHTSRVVPHAASLLPLLILARREGVEPLADRAADVLCEYEDAREARDPEANLPYGLGFQTRHRGANCSE